jgi:hypothetical protein
VFETNVFGVISVMQATLPLLRETHCAPTVHEFNAKSRLPKLLKRPKKQMEGLESRGVLRRQKVHSAAQRDGNSLRNRQKKACICFVSRNSRPFAPQAAAIGVRDPAGASTQLSYFQPTLEPTEHGVLHDFRVFWQSPRSC